MLIPYRLRSDTVFKGLSQNTLLVTVCKKASAFVPEKVWHHGSRGIQVFSTMYRTGSPTILYSQKALKAFVENDSRDAVFTWPCTSSLDGSSTVPFSMERVAASYAIWQMTSEIEQSIAICLMTQGDEVLESSMIKVAVRKKRKLGGDEERTQDRSTRLQAIPLKFVSNFIDVKPVCTTGRVASDDLIQQMEGLDFNVA
ncbi:hypothetical protein MP228_012774 [Amoeboaphelidium protococcarum]|nr:hypothetical protein MP228_012774 [Amoeboaphelidium protococcarum]